MRKYINWEIVVLLLALQWLINPFGFDLNDLFMERVFLIVFFALRLVIVVFKITFSTRVFWMFTLTFGFIGTVFTLNLFFTGKEQIASIFASLVIPLLIDDYKKWFGKSSEAEQTTSY
ncbi:hypothetical protein [Pseudalkalibacillus berkeleyi]|uniref:Uncharacterized protein n=1 Tax=Pseudalkalibacillus berkeleyi TaxID=1069813 RepID=A0ABS9GYH2_9BACL|nr:hypothetical protein [Pseudalkalibacillus berkeleyi]MCF6136694.1 hypothetical protein [Pseudalkalibacillus berkeleyi]